jgi:HSP20 family protein
VPNISVDYLVVAGGGGGSSGGGGAGGLLTGNVDSSDDNVVKDAEGQISELESELKAESSNHDILKAFYITESEETPVEYKVGDKVKYKRDNGEEVEKEIVKIEGDNFFFKELYWGTFTRTIVLPQEIEVEGAEAVEKHGLLIIRLPKIDKGRQTKLRVKAT